MYITKLLGILSFIILTNTKSYCYDYILHALPRYINTQTADFYVLDSLTKTADTLLLIDKYFKHKNNDLKDSFIVKAYQQVCFYQRTTMQYEVDYFDMIYFHEDKYSLPDSGNILLCIVQTTTGKKMYVQQDFKVLYEGKMYFMPRHLLSLIGKNIHETLRYNWAIKYNLDKNYFYFGNNVLQYKNNYYNINMQIYDKIRMEEMEKYDD